MWLSKIKWEYHMGVVISRKSDIKPIAITFCKGK